MRVRVSYGMDIKDVPSKVNKLLCDTTHKLEEALASLKRCKEGLEDSESEFSYFISSLDKTRQKLAGVDQSIQDAEFILHGLQNHYKGEQDVSDRGPTMDTSGDTAEET